MTDAFGVQSVKNLPLQVPGSACGSGHPIGSDFHTVSPVPIEAISLSR